MNFLLAGWVFWGAFVWNFRYFWMIAASTFYCLPMAQSGYGNSENPVEDAM